MCYCYAMSLMHLVVSEGEESFKAYFAIDKHHKPFHVFCLLRLQHLRCFCSSWYLSLVSCPLISKQNTITTFLLFFPFSHSIAVLYSSS